MAVSFNAIHIILIQRHLKTFEKERNCNRNRSTLQKLPEMYKNTIFRAYAYQPVGNRESWERKPTKHFGNQNYDAEKSEKILRSKVELQSLQHYNSSPLCAIAFSGLVLSLSPTGGRSWVRKKKFAVDLSCGLGCGTRFPATNGIYWSVWRAMKGRVFKQFSLRWGIEIWQWGS